MENRVVKNGLTPFWLWGRSKITLTGKGERGFSKCQHLSRRGKGDQGLVNVDKFELFIHLNNSNTKNQHFLEYGTGLKVERIFCLFSSTLPKNHTFFLNINHGFPIK